MFDLGWSELLVIGIVALIVVGPKDLPVMFRRMGEFTGRARRMAREFQTAMNDAAKDSGVGDVAGDLRKIGDPKRYGIDAIKDATKDLTAWRPDDAAKAGAGDPVRNPARPSHGPNTAALAEERAEARVRARTAAAERAGTGAAGRSAPLPDPHAPAPAPAPPADAADRTSGPA